MDKSFTEARNRHLRHGISKVRVSLVLIVLTAVMAVIWLYGAFSEQTVFACSDKEKNPVEIQKLCKRLTKHQWWGAYYQGKQQ